MEQDINTQWHQGFYGAAELEFDADKEYLDFITEHQLNKAPLQMDLLMIKKLKDVSTKNEIGHIFRKYNIFEYKSPEDNLSIDDYYKTMAYATLYKSQADKVNDIPADEITISLVRQSYPRELVKALIKEGKTIEERYPGIYYVIGALFPTQIVVTSKVNKSHHFLRVLSRNVQKRDVVNFVSATENMAEQGQRNNFDAIYQISVKNNKAIYDEIKEESEVMCEALMELMKPEFDAALEKAVNEKINEAINEAVNKAVNEAVNETKEEDLNVYANKMALKLGISVEKAIKILKD